MKVVSTVKEIKERLEMSQSGPVGLVPTMGALHNGHISLVNNAVNECPLVVVSIFVNPNQFNDKEDLKNYPRTIGNDMELLDPVLRKNDILFVPPVSEIYPVEDKRIFNLRNLDKVMEGAQRPGHFNGVAQVVSRLFEITGPDIAYFGQKDFQQIAIIRELVRQSGNSIIIKGNPIIRENDGLAMSSRNRLLEPGLREKAPVIFSAISRTPGMMATYEINEIRDFVISTINSVPGFSVEYFEIVDDVELKPVTKKEEMSGDKHYSGCIAVKAGRIRLIDNIEIPVV